MAYQLTRQALMLDLHAAYQCAKRKKAGKHYVRVFDRRLEQNLSELCDELLSRTYRPEPSSCFIIDRPKKREVVAAQFRDRIVHHLYYNYVHQLFERTFIQDSYSCIEGRGTHYGIRRMEQHIRSESHDYRRPCYALKIDIRGYFMHIDRRRLLAIVSRTIDRMATHRISRHAPETWADRIDIPFTKWLAKEIILLNPMNDCRYISPPEAWLGLDPSKSLRNSPDGQGVPIGNLPNQLHANIYLNELDQYCKRTLRCRHYGRYVDDIVILSHDRQWLRSLIPKIRRFLADRLLLDMHMGKTRITDARRGVEFLGAYLMPRRTYISNISLRRMASQVEQTRGRQPEGVWRAVNSWLGVLQHYRSFNIRCEMLLRTDILTIGHFDRRMTQFTRWQ